MEKEKEIKDTKTMEKLKESEEHYRIFAAYHEVVSELRKFYTVDASFEQMVQKTLDLIIEKFGYYMAWYAELIEEEKVILPKLWAGRYEKYLDGLRLEFESDKRDAKCAMSIVILTKKPFGYADLEHDKDFEKWRAFALQYGYRSNQAIPLIIDEKCKSAFLIYSTRPFAFSEKLVEYLKGIIDELATIIQNITQLKRFNESEAALIDSMIDGVYFIDLKGRFTRVNKAVEKWGYKKEDLIGEMCTKFMAEEDAPKVFELLKTCVERGSVSEIEVNLKAKDGRENPALISITLTKDLEGKPTGFIVVGKDITELKRVQEEVIAARDYTDNIIKSMIDTLIVVDPDAKIKTINQATSDLLGYKEEELIGKPVATIFAEKEVSIFKGTRLKKLIEEGAVRDYDMKYRTKKGKVIPVSFSGSVMRDKEDKIVGIVGIARDMREIKRLMQKEKELAEAAAAAAASSAEKKRADELQKLYGEMQHTRKELESSYAELQNSKDELVRSEKLAFTGRISASIAHEIRNPLTNVSMSVQQLKKLFKSKDRGAKHIDIIIRNTERVNYLITELLNSARPPKLNIQPHNIHRVLKGILESTKTKVKSQKIKVVKKFTSKPSIINIDKAQIERAFLNIVINAIESMPRGGKLTIITEVDEKLFSVKIQDTGKGIFEEDIIRIFDPFFSSKPDGVGLGLTICYGIIVSHGGTIEVESKPKKGSIFTVSLPIEQKVKRELRE